MSDEDKDPKEPATHTTLVASDPATWSKPDDMTWGDKFLRPDKPLNQRQRELCRLAAHGKTNVEIAKLLSYTQARVCVLLTNTKIKNEISRYRDLLFGVDVKTRLTAISSDALTVMGQILVDDTINVADKENAARYVIDKVDGKAAQQLDVSHTAHIGVFLDKLDQMDNVPALDASPPIDIIPHEANQELETVETTKKAPTPSGFGDWLDKNM
jgi:DNA-binding CsgD family transcriptional regulator